MLDRFTRLREKPRLPVLRSSLLRRMDQAVEDCVAGVLRSLGEGRQLRLVSPKTPEEATAVKL